jgi:hypothetical protein
MRTRGVIAFRDIEFGVWVLESEDGQVFQLAGGDRGLKAEGRRVEVEGDVDAQALTAAMVGPVLTVKRYKFI